jgi:antitoxin component YwqK of YwqJK toxin-antitoxin module
MINQVALQAIGKQFFDSKSEKSFNDYYRKFFPIGLSAAMGVLSDPDRANLVVSELFQSLWVNRDKFLFDDTKSHVSYVYSSALNKAKLALRKIRGSKVMLESSFGNESDEIDDSFADRLFSGTRDAIPMKRVKERIMSESVGISTSVFHSKYGRGVVMGSLEGELVVQFGENEEVIPTGEVSVCVVASDGSLHLTAMEQPPLETFTIKSHVSYHHDVMDFDQNDKTLEQQVMDSSPVYYDKIISILRNYEDNGLLFDAMINKINYSEICEKYKLQTSGAVKTRVFRAKQRLYSMIHAESQLSKMKMGAKFTGTLEYFDEKARLSYKCNYVDSKLEGKLYAFHPDSTSTIKVDANFENGVLSGSYKEYDTNGKMLVNGNYINGKEHGAFRYYKDNSLIYKLEWYQGEAGLLWEYNNGSTTNTMICEDDVHPIPVHDFNDGILYGAI